MATTPEGTPYVESSDLVANYPAVSLALAEKVDTKLNTTLTTKGDLISRSATVPTRLGIGANGSTLIANSTQATGLEWAPSSIISVRYATRNVENSTTSTAYVTTNLTQTITPRFTTSKILVITTMNMEKTTDSAFSGVFSGLFRGTVSGTLLQESLFYATGAVPSGQVTLMVLDEPATTSNTRYTVGFKTNSAAVTVKSSVDGNLATMIIMEVSA
jgi:hypothetical protein